jgi:hypothetical protein
MNFMSLVAFDPCEPRGSAIIRVKHRSAVVGTGPREEDDRLNIGLCSVLVGPLGICAAMVVAALVTSSIAHVQFLGLFASYFGASLAITAVSVLISLFWWTAQLAWYRTDEPLRVVTRRLTGRLPYLILPALVFPLFLVAFTATKTAIPFIVGYSWDAFWAHADRLLFREDAWRIAHFLLGTSSLLVWQWFYTVAWGLTLIFASALVALNARPSRVAIFYTAMMATWLIGGVFLAYAMSAAGPIFAHLFDAQLATHFSPLRQMLDRSLALNSPVRNTQQYLASSLTSHVAAKGGGISAMPSMHLAAATIYVLAARRSWWFVPAALFWAIIFVCSAYFGYHYWVDGLVAAAVAVSCWITAKRAYDSRLTARAAKLDYSEADPQEGDRR